MTELDPRNSASPADSAPDEGLSPRAAAEAKKAAAAKAAAAAFIQSAGDDYGQRRGRSAPRREEGPAHGRHRWSYHLRARSRPACSPICSPPASSTSSRSPRRPSGVPLSDARRHRRLRRGGHGRAGHLAVRLRLPRRAHRPEVQRHRAEPSPRELGHARATRSSPARPLPRPPSRTRASRSTCP